MTDFSQTIIKYLIILFLIYIGLKFIVPMILQFIGMLLLFVVKVIMWGAIIVILYLLANFIYQSRKNNGRLMRSLFYFSCNYNHYLKPHGKYGH